MEKIFKTEKIENFRKKNKLSKAVFCKNCKIGYTTLTRILRQDRTIKMISLYKIAIYMKVPLKDLYVQKRKSTV